MSKGILGRKLGMTQVFDDSGTAVPVTVIEAGPCIVVGRKTVDRDGYEALQIGFGECDRRRMTQPLQGHFDAANERAREARVSGGEQKGRDVQQITPMRVLREVPTFETDGEEYDIGHEIKADIFRPGDKVEVTGTSKGKGFAGVMKRHGFKGGPASHGASKVHRKPQSSGGTDAARTFKGTRKPGQMGNARVTVKGLTVVRADAERDLLLVRGQVPGATGGVVLIRGQ
ncbi:MAG: 50S ribosomal protein L3 [Armatimonadota bacterium]